MSEDGQLCKGGTVGGRATLAVRDDKVLRMSETQHVVRVGERRVKVGCVGVRSAFEVR